MIQLSVLCLRFLLVAFVRHLPLRKVRLGISILLLYPNVYKIVEKSLSYNLISREVIWNSFSACLLQFRFTFLSYRSIT